MQHHLCFCREKMRVRMLRVFHRIVRRTGVMPPVELGMKKDPSQNIDLYKIECRTKPEKGIGEAKVW